ncbi:MAG: PfkB family carbohydrate kinase, partial [Novosphingobium sp.]
LAALTGVEDFHSGIEQLAAKVPTVVVTRSENGAHAISNGEHAHVPAEPIDKVVDTTGAGDLFAAGFLCGYVRNKPLAESLTLGAICAAEVISHYGARPEANLGELVASRVG